MLEIKFVDQVLYKSFLEWKVQRHGWITIDLCNVEDQQKKIQLQIKGIAARCEETPLAGWGGGSQHVEKSWRFCGLALRWLKRLTFLYTRWPDGNLEIFWNFHLDGPWPYHGISKILAQLQGEKTSGGVIFWEFHDGVFFVYWEYWISILTMRSMSSLWKNRIDMIYWIGIQCLNVIFGGVGGAAFLVYVLFICFFRDSTCNPLAK